MIDTGDRTVDALISGLVHDGEQRNAAEVTYTFALPPELVGEFGYSVLSQSMIDRHLAVFAEVTALTGVTFREVDPNVGDSDLYFAFIEGTQTAYVVDYGPGVLHVYNPDRPDPVLGTYEDHLILHELGHGLGLEHGHGFGRLPSAFQGHSWSVMSYRAHPDTDDLWYADSHGPETYMPADIAAIQYLYGANFNTASGNTVYTVDFDTGEFLIDGVGQGVPVDRTTLRTVWDGNGYDTLDLSNAQASVSISLEPGAFTSFGEGFLAYQGESPFFEDLFAAGNIANPFLYNGNPASLLEAAVGSAYRDSLVGNIADNTLDGGGGDDSLFGLAGDDRLLGGAGNDLIVDGLGHTTATGDAGSDYAVALSGNGNLDGGAGDDILIGGIDNDVLTGGAGRDVLRGEATNGFLFGADVLTGGRGDDLLMGGRGADQFVFNIDDGDDVIGRFRASDLKINEATDVTAIGADFESGVDLIFLRGFVSVDAANVLDFLNDSETGAVFAAEGTSITFFDLTMADLQAEDFVFL